MQTCPAAFLSNLVLISSGWVGGNAGLPYPGDQSAKDRGTPSPARSEAVGSSPLRPPPQQSRENSWAVLTVEECKRLCRGDAESPGVSDENPLHTWRGVERRGLWY